MCSEQMYLKIDTTSALFRKKIINRLQRYDHQSIGSVILPHKLALNVYWTVLSIQKELTVWPLWRTAMLVC